MENSRHRALASAPARTLVLGSVPGVDGEVLAVRMPGPGSFTGEDVVELQCHGGTLVARRILGCLLEAGCRHAEPGEFTKRAFLNGRIDLTQAEAVADLVGAHSESALRLANRQLDGLLGRRVRAMREALHGLLCEMEVRLDFPEEDLDWRSEEEVLGTVREACALMDQLIASRREGEILRHGVSVAIVGPPNVGKSSLLNAILGRDRAIVTEIPGTTRDTLEEFAHIRGIPVRLTDTAGIREPGDRIERSGIERSHEAARNAQLVLWVGEATRPESVESIDLPEFEVPLLKVANKADLLSEGIASSLGEGVVLLSALTGEGLDELYDAIERAVWEFPHARESDVAVNARHAALLEEARGELNEVETLVAREEWELGAICLRASIDAIGRVTGDTIAPDILDNIFSEFCIGK